eukprot:s593_g19.t1
MQVNFGSQFLQLFGRVMDSMNVSSAVIFVDLSNAFHKLVRELVSGVHVPDDIEAVLEQLLHEGMPMPELVELLQLPCLLERLHAPSWLLQLVRDIHTHTWMQVPGLNQPVRTRKGTRPGSPLADCIFHILMQDITKEVNDILLADEAFQAILTQADFQAESIVWADDLAIPIATVVAADLPAAICRTLQAVHRLFQRRGFTFNMQKGKTSVVATFKGTGAPAMRAQFQLTDPPGMTIRMGHEDVFVHFMPCYKHLGTIFSSAHTLDQEIAVRIGMAKSSFAQISRPILCNRNIPLATRLQLFRSLILSKLFFGLGSWHTPSHRQMMKLQGALVFMLRKVFRLTPEQIQTTSTAELLHRSNVGTPRARLAIDRLLFAQRIWQFGPAMLQHAIHREEALTVDSWLFGLKHDLVWLCQLDCQDVPALTTLAQQTDPQTFDLTQLIDFWQSGSRLWKRCVKRAWKRHVQQEAMMTRLHAMHKQFFRLFYQAGASFEPHPLEADVVIARSFACHCGRCFSTPQGLACHKRLRHKEFAPEHDLVSGTTCPEYLKFFCTKQRLYQHLSYIPRTSQFNKCFQALKRKGFCMPAAPGAYHKFPPAVRGLARVETLQLLGPLPPDFDASQQRVEAIARELDQIDRDLDDIPIPPDVAETSQQLWDFLTDVTHTWFEEFCQKGFDEAHADCLPDRWLSVLTVYGPEWDNWIEAEILDWGQLGLPDIISGFLDGSAEHLVDHAYAEMVADFPRQQLLQRKAFLQAQHRQQDEQRTKPFPHRPVRVGAANPVERAYTAAHVPSLFETQTEFLQQVRNARWLDMPSDQGLPGLSQPSGAAFICGSSSV